MVSAPSVLVSSFDFFRPDFPAGKCRRLCGPPIIVPPGQLKAALLRGEAVEVPPRDAWRVPYLSRLLSARLKCYYSGDVNEEKQLMSLIDSLVIN